jgi:hypothetical protein
MIGGGNDENDCCLEGALTQVNGDKRNQRYRQGEEPRREVQKGDNNDWRW